MVWYYLLIEADTPVYSVGYYDVTDRFIATADFRTEDEAQSHADWLNSRERSAHA